MKLSLNRRTLLAGVAVGVAALGLGGWVSFARSRAMIGRIVRRHVPSPPIPESALDAFYNAFWPQFEARLGRRRGLLLAATEMGVPVVRRLDSEVVRAAERNIVTAFLLGSDFFRRSPGEEKPLRWIGLTEPCQNPFRRR